jgi:hypothetical protein
MRKQVVLAGLILLGGVACPAQTVSVAGEWRGIWTNPAGLVFTATMTLETGPSCKTCAVISDGGIRGKIVWTLRKAGSNAAPEVAGLVGATATELVKGEMKGDGLLVLNGYEADDPAHIKGMDQYRLAISDNGRVIGGITLNGGSWTGQFIAVRVLPPERPAPQ